MTAARPPTNTTGPSVDEKISAPTWPDATAGTPGVVTGRPLTWLRVEGLAVAGAASVLRTCFALTDAAAASAGRDPAARTVPATTPPSLDDIAGSSAAPEGVGAAVVQRLRASADGRRVPLDTARATGLGWQPEGGSRSPARPTSSVGRARAPLPPRRPRPNPRESSRLGPHDVPLHRLQARRPEGTAETPSAASAPPMHVHHHSEEHTYG